MNMFRTAVGVAALTVAGSAFAADLPRRAPPPYLPPPPIMTWTGFHFGVNAGARFGGNTNATTIGAPVFLNPALAGVGGAASQIAIDNSFTNFVGTGSRTGAVLGVQAGYDYQFYNSFLIGIEADVQGVISPGTQGLFGNVQPVIGGGAPAGQTVTSFGFVQKRQDWLGTVRARLGYTFTPAFLLYATGGLAYGGVKSTTVISSTFSPPVAGAAISGATGTYSTNRVGYAVGAGAEYLFSPSFSLKAEYLYYNLGSTSYNGGLSNGTAAGVIFSQDAVRTRVKFDGHLARVGVNYHFWGPPAAPVVARY